jgi:hypothetical protein
MIRKESFKQFSLVVAPVSYLNNINSIGLLSEDKK